MSLDEEALQAVANGGSMDLEKWAGIATPLLERLEYIVYNVFPVPKVPPGSSDQHLFPRAPSQSTEANAVQPESSTRENAAPTDPQTPSPAQAPTGSPPTTERVPDSQHPQSFMQPSEDTLPPSLALLLNSIRSAIRSFFMEKPPHTIQRLAELVLRPTAHYKTLPAYLRAVDRVVSVTSGADVFPSSTPANTSPQPNGLVHPTNSAGAYLAPDYVSGLGSDESLGGALLTPIPWLNNASFEGDDANALEVEPVPTRPQPQEADTDIATTTDTTDGDGPAQRTSASPPAESADEVPHPRGPPVVGVEDLGLQDGKGVEMNLGAEGTPDATSGQDADDTSTGTSTTETAGDSMQASEPEEKE